jgi:hypothetical protein
MIAGPVPVRPLIKCGGDLSDLGFISGVAIEIGGRGQRAREEKSRVDGRQFALPDPTTRFYVEKMIEEALIARCVGLRSLGTLPQKSQSLSSNLGREFPNEDAALEALIYAVESGELIDDGVRWHAAGRVERRAYAVLPSLHW